MRSGILGKIGGKGFLERENSLSKVIEYFLGLFLGVVRIIFNFGLGCIGFFLIVVFIEFIGNIFYIFFRLREIW